MRAEAQKMKGNTSFSMGKDVPSLSMVPFERQGKPLRSPICAEERKLAVCSFGSTKRSSGSAEWGF
jgi:hypothetical protein